jgi:hypothetical protein
MNRTMSETVTFTASGGTVTVSPSEGDLITLGHGTDIASAQYIAGSGINYEMAVGYGGGGSFWTTEDLDWAKWCAFANPADGDPALVTFGLPVSVVQGALSSLPPLAAEHDNKTYEFYEKCFKLLNQSMVNATVHILKYDA